MAFTLFTYSSFLTRRRQISGGGHALNPGFSSTTGIHVSMSGFDTLEWHKDENAIDIGAGLRWDHVYDYLNPEGYTVVGGRVRGVGVAGFILGGGLSFKTNQLGLTIDTLKSCEVVLPNGTFVRASHDEHRDLFFGLKGGFNNFGIVTKFTLGVYPQTDIWGGTVILAEKDIGGAHDAVVKFADTVTDPKATLNIIYEYAEGELNAIVILFYDAPSPPPRLFDELLAIPNGKVTAASMSFATLLSAGQPRNTPRRIQDVAPVQKYTPKFLDSIANETKHWGSFLEKHHSGHFFDYVVEVFLPTYYSHGTESAWPPSRDPASVHYPVNIAFAWYEKAHDQAVWDALKTSVAKLRADAEAEGQNIENAELYPNLPIEGTPLERMYGKNLPRLRALRDVYDPERVMDLTGGWRF
ncbi:hypothetical protein NLJ89_g6831 [Agrocybe chaxingu]|uniref:FAD-binding PCMH-type domain-containing protein n=1 Tax=Agrocybe chaxingu TaxID=84603 RepID=A0A9W8MW13_9AGAR|nr:hypothetical protein NLJ89_g6831 [Agrocybe chaxingu]